MGISRRQLAQGYSSGHGKLKFAVPPGAVAHRSTPEANRWSQPGLRGRLSGAFGLGEYGVAGIRQGHHENPRSRMEDHDLHPDLPPHDHDFVDHFDFFGNGHQQFCNAVCASAIWRRRRRRRLGNSSPNPSPNPGADSRSNFRTHCQSYKRRKFQGWKFQGRKFERKFGSESQMRPRPHLGSNRIIQTGLCQERRNFQRFGH